MGYCLKPALLIKTQNGSPIANEMIMQDYEVVGEQSITVADVDYDCMAEYAGDVGTSPTADIVAINVVPW